MVAVSNCILSKVCFENRDSTIIKSKSVLIGVITYNNFFLEMATQIIDCHLISKIFQVKASHQQ
jgi:hypothetical protein